MHRTRRRLAVPLLAGLTATLLLAACMARLVAPPPADPPADPAQGAASAPDAASAPLDVTTVGRAAERVAVQGAMASAAMPLGAAPFLPVHPAPPPNTERYAAFDDNPVKQVARDPVSTFSVDVDTASYAIVRRHLTAGALPPADAVRTEELVNYFSYDDAAPRDPALPFSITTELAPAPWNADRLLLRIGLKGYQVPAAARPPANLVFLVDVSGSMQSPDKLPLLKQGLALLVRQLTAADRLSLVVYAGASGLVLPPTPGDRRAEIMAALGSLEAGGSTNGGEGIALAYAVARQAYLEGGINRVLLATDGDFNVGTVDQRALTDMVARQRGAGIALTTLGFGSGNYNDALMERLADQGDGNYAYVDTLFEARKVLVEQVAGTLQVIAGDVKAQLEFNPERVAEYRLIGYENRVLRAEDFNDDAVDAGDVGAGHSVVALYELTPVGAARPAIDPLRYADGGASAPTASERIAAGGARADELAFLKLRYKRPGEQESELIRQPVRADAQLPLARTSADFRFAAAVAAFGQRLRGGEHLGRFGWDAIAALARDARGADPRGERAELLRLVGLAGSLAPDADLALRSRRDPR